MVGLFPKLIVILGALALSACVAGGGDSGKAVGPNPVTGTAIEVTALDAPAAKPATKPPTELATELATKPAPVTPVEKAGAATPTDPAAPLTPLGDTPKPAPPAETQAAAEEAATVPVVEKSPAQLICEKRGNIWAQAGNSGAHACVTRLKDGGKRCTSGKQCQGDCLARSNTCAPISPLFGCNEILQDNGARVTLCLD